VELVVNARFLEKELRGIGRYAIELSRGLKGADPSIKFVSSGRWAPALEGIAAKLETVRVARLTGHWWEQISLPRYLAARGRPLLLNFVNTGPLAYDPQVTTIHDLAYHRHPEAFSPAFRSFYRVVVPAVAHRSRRVLAVSEFVKRELVDVLRLDPGKISVVSPFVAGHLVNLARTQTPSRAGEFILTVGSLNPRKNLKRVLGAFVRAHLPGMSLVVVGERRSIFAREDLSGLVGPRVEFTGYLDDAELVGLYKSARLFVYPSLYEGFGIPPLEAMLCGCPVIVANRASMPEVCGSAALYVDPLDEEAIAAAMERLAGDEEERARLVMEGRRVAASFNLDRSLARLLQVLQEEAR
jgi:glycosyltransferase involved in cell wall biosynthesis